MYRPKSTTFIPIVLLIGLQGCGSGGDGNTTPVTPVNPTSQTIVALSGNSQSTLLLNADGHLYVTGINRQAVLGMGTEERSFSAFTRVPIESFGKAVTLQKLKANYTSDTQTDNTSFALSNISLFSAGDNASAQQGLGDKTLRGRFTYNPIADPNLKTIVDFAGSNAYSIALTSDGTVWGTGLRATNTSIYDAYGDDVQTGITTPESTTWVKVSVLDGATPVQFSHIAAGPFSAYYLDQTGSLWVAGDNRSCQLGTQCGTNTIPVITKVIINDAGGNPVGFTGIAAGKNGAVLIANDGALWVAGANTHSRFSGAVPQYDNFTRLDLNDAEGNTIRFTQVSISANTTLAVTDRGQVYAAGKNFEAGQNYTLLGLSPTITDQDAFRPLSLPGAINIILAEARDTHTILLDTNNTLWVVGENNAGELGTGDTLPLFAFRRYHPVLY